MKSDSMPEALFFCALLMLLLGILELLVRRKVVGSDSSRRIMHITSGLFAIGMYYYFAPMIFLVCNLLLLVFIGLSYYRKMLKSVHDVRRKTYGEVLLPLGIMAAFAMSYNEPQVFVPALLVLTFADAAAGVVGDIRQKQRASRIGSLVFFITSAALLAGSLGDIRTAMVLALALTAVERVSPLGSDNLTIPVAAVILLTI